MATNKLMKELKEEQKNNCFGQILPYRMRRLVMLYDGTQKSIDLVARKTHLQPNTIKSWLRDPRVIKALQARDTVYDAVIIADRVQRKEFWTDVMNSEEADMKDRLKASELLGKSECDFSETRVLKGGGANTTVIINTGVPRAPDEAGCVDIKAMTDTEVEIEIKQEDVEINT